MEEELEQEEGLKFPSELKYKTGEKLYIDDFFENKTFKEKIVSYFRGLNSKFFHAKYDFVEGIKSLWYWRKMIWRDRPWGNHQIIDILIFKIKRDHDTIKKNNHTESTEEVCDSMMRVMELLQRYNENEYMQKYREMHEAKWGDSKQYFIELTDGNYEWKSERDDNFTKEQAKEERADYRKYAKQADLERANDLKEAFKIMQKDLDGWWD